MNLLRHFVILALILAAFIVVGHLIPQALSISPDRFSLLQETAAPDTTAITKVLPFRDALAQSIPVLKVTTRRHNPIETWTVGKGIALPAYLLKAQRKIIALGGHVVRMEELNSTRNQPAAKISWKTATGDTATVEIHIGDEFLEGSSNLSLAFVLDAQPSSAEVAELHKLSIPLSILVNPFDSNSFAPQIWTQQVNTEIVAWVGMEPHRYPWVSPGPHSILIHHTEKEIRALVEDVAQKLPTMVGIASRMGERAVEHKPLLQALIRSIGERNLWFLDLTNSRFSRSLEVCSELKVPCRMSQIMPSSKKASEYLQAALNSALRTGNASVILPLSEDNIEAVRAIIPLAEAQGTEIVKLSSQVVQQE